MKIQAIRFNSDWADWRMPKWHLFDRDEGYWQHAACGTKGHREEIRERDAEDFVAMYKKHESCQRCAKIVKQMLEVEELIRKAR